MNTKNNASQTSESFFMIPRSIISQLSSKKEIEKKIAILKIILISSAYHTDGFRTLNGRTYRCLKGEYLGTYRRLAEKTGISKSQIQRYLIQMEKDNLIRIEKVPDGTRIRLLKYLEFLAAIEKKKDSNSSA